MTAPQTAPETRTEVAEPTRAMGILDEILSEVRERGPRREPETLVGLTLRSADDAVELFRVLHEQSLKKTYPEDWVKFTTQDGAEVCYLQDVGCDRVAGLWQIDFSRAHPASDVIGRDLDDGHYVAEVIVQAHSQLTGQTMEELGFRSTEGFFERAWEKAREQESAVQMERIKANVKKAAIANAHGRIVRGIAGLDQVPLERLKAALGPDKMKRIRGAEFQSGTKGGSGGYASEPQLKLIAGEALKKVSGLSQALKFDEIVEKVRSAHLTGGRGGKASQVIERLKAAEPNSVTVAQFEQALGVTLIEDGDEG